MCICANVVGDGEREESHLNFPFIEACLMNLYVSVCVCVFESSFTLCLIVRVCVVCA